MKKKILCFMLATVLLLCSMPLSVLASVTATATATSEEDSLPMVCIDSYYSYEEANKEEYRALPDSEGNFIINFSLNKQPTVDENIIVYYRTVDDSAVAAWGDYTGVGMDEEASVTLNKENGYSATITVQSIILETAAHLTSSHSAVSDSSNDRDRIVSRRFYFEITRVVGNAVPHKGATATERDRSGFYCYLRAKNYFETDMKGNSSVDRNMNNVYQIYTQELEGHILYYNYFSIRFRDDWKALVDAGYCDVGLAIHGKADEGWLDDNGALELCLAASNGGGYSPIFDLNVCGEFDDCQFYGWELAYDYLDGTYPGKDSDGDEFNVDDFIRDNFHGMRIYDSNGQVYVDVMIPADASDEYHQALNDALREMRRLGIVVSTKSNSYSQFGYNVSSLHYVQMPSNLVHATSIRYSIESRIDGSSSYHKRWLEGVQLDFALISNYTPRILKDENEVQMVTTNVNEMKAGDPLKLKIRFDNLVYLFDYENCYITAKINGQYPVTLKSNQQFTTDRNSTYCYVWDTLVFEGELPEEVMEEKITSITDIQLVENGKTGIRGFFSDRDLLGKTIDSLYNQYDRDLRAPQAIIGEPADPSWVKSDSVNVSAKVAGTSGRFTDNVTVLYQWSNSPELPETYSGQLNFQYKQDRVEMQTILGTGNGEMYLHLKAISRYGRETISDKQTGIYNPDDPDAVYTPFGPYLFDNTPPTLSAEQITVEGSLKKRTVTIPLPDDAGRSGTQAVYLYYKLKGSTSGEGTLLRTFTADQFTGDPKTLQFTISHDNVGVGVDANGELYFDRKEIEFYWILTDRLGNTSDKVGGFSLVFDTNNYLENEITSVGAYDLSTDESKRFQQATERVDELTFLYDYRLNRNLTAALHPTLGSAMQYGFGFIIEDGVFGETDLGTYDAIVTYKGATLTADVDYAVERTADACAVWFLGDTPRSGLYSIQLRRTEGTSVRVSQTYYVYFSDGMDDVTPNKSKVESGTLLGNTVYQLSSDYPYFYYKDAEGTRQKEYYNGVRQPATFSSYSMAKSYVYYMELSDICLVELTAATANALNSGTTGFMKAKGETAVPQAGQFWIRYKSDAWTPNSGDSAWVYYYYGMTGELSENALSINLQNALNTVANRIVSYGRSVTLTDASLFLDGAVADPLLDKYGMPYLLEGQIHSVGETSVATKCGNVWSIAVQYAPDRNIYKSNVHVGEEGTATYAEYPIVGNFALVGNSRFQYMTYAEYHGKNTPWRELTIDPGKTFIDVLTASGVYYIREMATEGVGTYAIYVDKEAPKVSFTHTDDEGNLQDIPIDGVEILDIRTKDLFVGSISEAEYDRLSYVAVYKVSNLALAGLYMADDLDGTPIKLEDGNYYIVVSDRSGNHYTVTARVSSSELACAIKETADKFIRLTCNRRDDQISAYEIRLNGELITSTYAADQTFDKAGLYSIYVQDIYGNIYTEEYLFTRNYPSVTWKYLGEDGKYHEYDPESDETTGFILTWVYDNNYKISTSVKTRFSFSENYTYEFVGTAPEYTETIGTETVVTIGAGQPFTLKVAYKNHRDCYTLYSGIVDVTPPTISVSAEVDVQQNGEYEHFDQWAAAGNVGDVMVMDELYFVLAEIGRRTVENGGIVSSDIIKIDAVDANDLALMEVYLNGELIRQQDMIGGFSQIVVSQWGDYRIVAKDTLGNVAEFTFTNGMPDHLDYFVDGVEKEPAFHGYLNFQTVNGKQVYTLVDYGNTEFKLDVKQNADVFLSLEVSGGNTEVRGFRIQDGCIYLLTYYITLDTGNRKAIEISTDQLVLDIHAEDFRVGQDYRLNADGTHPIYASVNDEQIVSIKVYAPEDTEQVVSVSARVGFDIEETIFFVSSELSKKRSEVTFKDSNGNTIPPLQSGTDIHANNGFTVDETLFESERVSGVWLYYSKLNNLDADQLQGRNDIYSAGTHYADEGFYMLVVENLFGNRTAYRIIISRSFGVTSSVTFADGYKTYYSKDFSDTLYSNGEITLDVLDEEVTYAVTLNGTPFNDYARKAEDGVIYLVFSHEGTYEITLTDSYGNVITRRLEIDRSSYSVADELLTGYNEKALRRDEGYTNQMLSIDPDIFAREGIYYLAIRYGEEMDILYDAFAEEPIQSEAQDLIDVIGTRGDGTYTVICRNRYGSVVTKEVHYRGTPTLKLERTIRSNLEPQAYDLNYALQLGFWSNNTLIFRSEAETYVFTVNGSQTECPRTLVFEHAGDYGSFEYEITYLDEYGFEYAFKAYLVRKNITITVPSSITGMEVDGVLNTQSDISITFGENMYAVYTRNNGEEVNYHSGEVLQKDGTYRFTVLDYAGNASTVTLKKDTTVEFRLVESESGAVIQNGGVVNTTRVSFSVLNRDSAYIEMVLLDGVVQTDFTGSKFSENGKWELILSDRLGNKAYFCFYVLTHAQSDFIYTTPYEYRITELWYDNGDGVPISYMEFVHHDEFTSGFHLTENGSYSVVMTSDVTGLTSTFEFTIDSTPPAVTLVGCGIGETTINDVTLEGCKVGDRILIYRATEMGEELVQVIEVASQSTKMPVITEGGEYRIVVESEAGVTTEMTFIRKHVMNTAGSVFIMVMIGFAVVALFTGLVYRNKSKTDD